MYKMTFKCPGLIGLFEWAVMTFGLKNTNITYCHTHFKVKTECIPLCVSGSIFTYNAINSSINSITRVYYNIS
jgi:hypothetical protein